MYDYIYFFFYSLFTRLRTIDPKENATSVLLLAVFGHIFLILMGIKFYFGLNLITAAYGEGHSKYLWLPVIILIMFLVYRIYKKRFEIVAAKYADRSNLVSTKNSIVIAILVLGPYLLAIYFLNHS